MRVAIVSPNIIRITPYVSFYFDLLVENGHKVDVFFPERTHEHFDKKDYYGFSKWNSKFNVINYFKYKKWIKRQISNKYDFVICLSMQTGFLLYGTLLKRFFKNNYIIDIRDYSYEKYAIFRNVEKKVVENAKLCIVSSPEFCSFLPKHHYLIAHNISFDQKEHFLFNKRTSGAIIISYVGAISYYTQCKKMIDLVLNDDRFCLFFYGRGTESARVDQYINEIGCERIKSFGSFEPGDKKKIILSSDILFNVYGNEDIRLRTALSNKLYDSLYYKKPILNSVGTFMSRISPNSSFEIDFSDAYIMDKLYSWYFNIDEKSFNLHCDELLDSFQNENLKTKMAIIKSLSRSE